MTATAMGAAPAPWRHPAFRLTLTLAAVLGGAIVLGWDALSAVLFDLELALADLVPAESWDSVGLAALPLLAFGAGLLASLSPCVLPLVPLNLALIGASGARGWAAAGIAGRFVLGSALALAALGLAADAAGFLLVAWRGAVLIVSGVAMLVLAGMALELVPVPFAGRAPGAGRRLGPIAAGAAFSVVTTPCASPLVGGVLAAAAAQGVPGFGAISMLAFSLGYTALVFAAGVLGGDVLARFRGRSLEAPRASAAAVLLVAGAGFTLTGVAWF